MTRFIAVIIVLLLALTNASKAPWSSQTSVVEDFYRLLESVKVNATQLTSITFRDKFVQCSSEAQTINSAISIIEFALVRLRRDIDNINSQYDLTWYYQTMISLNILSHPPQPINYQKIVSAVE